VPSNEHQRAGTCPSCGAVLPVLLATLGHERRPLLRLLPHPAPWNPGPLTIGITFSSGQLGNTVLKINAGVPEPSSSRTWLFSG